MCIAHVLTISYQITKGPKGKKWSGEYLKNKLFVVTTRANKICKINRFFKNVSSTPYSWVIDFVLCPLVTGKDKASLTVLFCYGNLFNKSFIQIFRNELLLKYKNHF